MSKYNPLKAGIWYTICNMVIKGIPFLTLPIFTHLMSPDDFGKYNIYLSYENVLSVVCALGISGTIRTAKVEFKSEYTSYVKSLILLQIIIYILACPVICWISSWGIKEIWITKRIMGLLVFHCLASSLINLLSGAYAISGQVKQNIVMSLTSILINIVASIWLIYYIFNSQKYVGRIMGTALGNIVPALVFSFLYCRNVCLKGISNKWKFALKMGLPLLPHMLSMIIMSQCDKLMIERMVNSYATGIYSLGVTLASIVTVIVTSIDNAWAPWFFSNLEKENYSNILSGNDILASAFSMICMMAILVMPEIVRFVSAGKYWDCIYVAIPLIVSVFINFMYIFSVNTEYYFKQTGFISISTAISVCVNVVLNYCFIISFGYIAAAYATCISKFVLFCLHAKKANSLLKMKIITNRKLLVELAVLLLVAGFCLMTVQAPFLRWSLALGIGIILLGKLKMNLAPRRL